MLSGCVISEINDWLTEMEAKYALLVPSLIYSLHFIMHGTFLIDFLKLVIRLLFICENAMHCRNSM